MQNATHFAFDAAMCTLLCSRLEIKDKTRDTFEAHVMILSGGEDMKHIRYQQVDAYATESILVASKWDITEQSRGTFNATVMIL